ncbi:MAG: hypothetical protein ACR2PT_20575 [Endozoicomonas sp.]
MKIIIGAAALSIALSSSLVFAGGQGPNPCKWQHAPKTFNCKIAERKRAAAEVKKNKIVPIKREGEASRSKSDERR